MADDTFDSSLHFSSPAPASHDPTEGADSSDIFASSPVPSKSHSHSQSHPHSSTTHPSTTPPLPPTISREDALRSELSTLRKINASLAECTSSLQHAQRSAHALHASVASSTALLDVWTRILSQTEHNQRLLLSPGWQGASRDTEEREGERRRREERERTERERKERERAEREREKAAVGAAEWRGGAGSGGGRGRRGGTMGTGRGGSRVGSTAGNTAGRRAASGIGAGRGRGK